MIHAMPSPSPSPSPCSVDLSGLQTEERNAATEDIDVVSTTEMLQMINDQDQTVALAVQACIPTIGAIVDAVAPRVARGGRVIYVGAGTSGRLGILDASEIPPTFSAPYGQFVGLIAGGARAIQFSVEGAEDSPALGAADVAALRLDPELDSVVGLAASGRTPYVLGAVDAARRQGCFTAGVCCVSPSALSATAEVTVECPVGPEAITGSTRMKSGTAQKMVLNMLSSGVMLRLGKTHGNLMVDVRRSNAKLLARARGIFRSVLEPYRDELGVELALELGDDAALDAAMDAAGGVKPALVAARWRCSPAQAEGRLRAAGGILKRALEEDLAAL